MWVFMNKGFCIDDLKKGLYFLIKIFLSALNRKEPGAISPDLTCMCGFFFFLPRQLILKSVGGIVEFLRKSGNSSKRYFLREIKGA